MSIADRLKHILKTEVKPSKRYKVLQEATGISAESWRAFENDKQKPSAEMIERAAQLWPERAYWLVTGFGGNTPKQPNFEAEACSSSTP